jgi:hypothetical protein
LKTLLSCAMAVLVLVGVSAARELPEAPSAIVLSPASPSPVMPVAAPAVRNVETKIVDTKFAALALVSAGSTFADSYTTLFARQNWLAGKTNVCNMEVESAYLYGTHPTVGRAYAVASVKTASSVLAAYYLRKHHSKFWSAPLVVNSIVGLQGVTQNMRACN